MSGVDIAGIVERLLSDIAKMADGERQFWAEKLTPLLAALEAKDRALLAQAAELAEARPYREELLKIAADVGEPDDPFAAWEGVQALTRQRDEALAALKASEEALKGVIFWLEGALQCKDWHWDADQGALAADAMERARSVLENGPADLADATNNPPSDPGTEQREAGV